MRDRTRKHGRFPCVCLLLALSSAAGCSEAVDRPKLPRFSPPDDAGTARFAQQLLQAARAGNAEALVALVDADLLAERATLGLELPPEVVQGLQRQLFDNAKARGIFRMLIESAVQGGGVRYLVAQSQPSGGQRWAVFRVLQPNAAFDHYRFLVTQRPDGAVRAVDWQQLSIGESVSSLMRRLLLPEQGERLREFAGLLPDEEALLWRYAPQVTQMQQAMQANDPRRALAIYKALP
jgi:hypothetical protein